MRKIIKQEYPFHRVSIKALWIALTSPVQLKEWFAEDVKLEGQEYIFYWDSMPHEAQIVRVKEYEEIVFQWKEGESEDFFMFRCIQNELTKEITLEITDTCEESDYDMTLKVWESQIEMLQRIIGK